MIWELKNENKTFSIKWKILSQARPYSNVTKKCNLCMLEKFYIICKPKLASLNKRSELISKCRHMAKYLLGNVT